MEGFFIDISEEHLDRLRDSRDEVLRFLSTNQDRIMQATTGRFSRRDSLKIEVNRILKAIANDPANTLGTRYRLDQELSDHIAEEYKSQAFVYIKRNKPRDECREA